MIVTLDFNFDRRSIPRRYHDTFFDNIDLEVTVPRTPDHEQAPEQNERPASRLSNTPSPPKVVSTALTPMRSSTVTLGRLNSRRLERNFEVKLTFLSESTLHAVLLYCARPIR